MRRFLPVPAVACVLFASPLARAADIAVTHQGYLLDGQDHPIERTATPMSFAIWADAASPDTANRKWTSGACTVDVRQGRYGVVLGGGSAAGSCGAALSTDALPIDGARFLEVTIDGTVLTPRLRLGTAPTAGLAADALSLGGHLAKDYALKSELDFAKLSNVPEGLADGDDDTRYTAGDGLVLDGTKFALAGPVALARGGTGADLSATGGAGQYVKQGSAGGALSVGAIAAADLPTGIDATKLAGGGVTNAQFGYLAGVTGSIQQQISGRAASGTNSDITSLTGLTTALSVGQGGTGATSLAGNGALVMNAGGTAAAAVAPGAVGNVLASNGTTWVSAAPALSTTDRQRLDAIWEYETTRNCQVYLQNNPSATDGTFSLRIWPSKPAISVYCNMTKGGWMRLAVFNDGGGVTDSMFPQAIPVTTVRVANQGNFDDGAEAYFPYPVSIVANLDVTSTNGWRVLTTGAGGYGLYSGISGTCNWGNPTIWGAGYNGSCGTTTALIVGYTGGATTISRRFTSVMWGR